MMVLRLLEQEPAHGYALVQRIKQVSNDMLQVEEGSLYPALQRLLKAKLLTAECGVSATNRKVRIYRITAASRKHLAAEVSSFEQMLVRTMNPFMWFRRSRLDDVSDEIRSHILRYHDASSSVRTSISRPSESVVTCRVRASSQRY
jgi:PadR family transcriptional regulator PadR